MISYLENHQIDFEKWDDCIERSLNGIFYAYSWYLDMTAPGWAALVEGDYETVMPLPSRKKLGINYVYQPFFVQQLGIFSTKSLLPEVTMRLLNAIPRNYRFADLNLNTYNQANEEFGIKTANRITHHLDLIEPYEQIVQRYSTNTRRNIKKAEKAGVFVTSHGRPEEIIETFRNNRGRELKAFSEGDYKVLKHLIYSGMHRGMVTIMSAYTLENNFCAGIVFFQSHKKTVFLFSGSTPQARENGAMFMLVDAFIMEMAGKELVLDFEGSSDPQLARFYKGFGSKECVFLQIEINRMPFGLRQLAGLYRRLQKKKRTVS
ncbi:MAG: hypothetical protein K0B09_11495 [Bacteroidales bacterium]|nr:hypothetical protein [Bacteroidales bacterium]